MESPFITCSGMGHCRRRHALRADDVTWSKQAHSSPSRGWVTKVHLPHLCVLQHRRRPKLVQIQAGVKVAPLYDDRLALLNALAEEGSARVSGVPAMHRMYSAKGHPAGTAGCHTSHSCPPCASRRTAPAALGGSGPGT